LRTVELLLTKIENMLTDYRVTVTVQDLNRVKEWLLWMYLTHIPHILATGIPLDGSGKIYKVEELEPKAESTTFVVSYHFNSKEDLMRYRSEYGKRLGQEYEDAGWMKATKVTREMVTPVPEPAAA
jgi:hypothetical protein